MWINQYHKKLVLTLLCLLISLPFALAQGTDDGTILLKTGNGLLIVHNQKGLYYTMELKGDNIAPLESQDQIFLKVDGRVVQLQTLHIDKFSKEKPAKKSSSLSVLEKHRDWEVNYLSNTLGKKLQVASGVIEITPNRKALFWQYPMPEGFNQHISEQLYLTISSGNFVQLINCSVEGTDTKEAAKKFMVETFSTIKVSDKPIDVKLIQEAIRKGQF